MSLSRLLLFLIVCGCFASAQTPAQCGGWDGLIGDWDADANPSSPGVTGWTTFTLDVEGKVIVRKNHAEYPATKEEPASVHDDLMVIYSETDQRRAMYWDSEGHVIRYIASVSSDGCKLTLITPPGESGPRFRLTYSPGPAPGVEAGLFEIAPPGQRSEFKPYRKWTLHRRTAKTQ